MNAKEREYTTHETMEYGYRRISGGFVVTSWLSVEGKEPPCPENTSPQPLLAARSSLREGLFMLKGVRSAWRLSCIFKHQKGHGTYTLKKLRQICLSKHISSMRRLSSFLFLSCSDWRSKWLRAGCADHLHCLGERSVYYWRLCALVTLRDSTTTTLLLRVADLYYQMHGVDIAVAPHTRLFLVQHGFGCRWSEEETDGLCLADPLE